MILHLAILIQYRRVTDGQTHDNSIYHTSIASSGNKMVLIKLIILASLIS